KGKKRPRESRSAMAVRNRDLNSAAVESCPYRHTVGRRDGVETATCGFLAELLGETTGGSCEGERGVCECWRQSFISSAQNPNPVVASMLYGRAMKLADALPPGHEADRLRSVAERAQSCLDVIYASPLPNRQRGVRGNLPALAEIVPPPAARHG